MQTTERSLSCAETAKLVRAAVKEAFPGVKFSVRSHTYAGGASIDVRWTDGPRERDVRPVIDRFAGADFDGMTDMKNYRGPALFGNEDGSVECVRYGADFVHGSRTISDARYALIRREVERFTGEPFDPNRRYKASAHFDAQLARDESGEWGSTLVNQIAHGRTWHGERCPGGDGSYCPGCGRWQGEHRAPHLH